MTQSPHAFDHIRRYYWVRIPPRPRGNAKDNELWIAYSRAWVPYWRYMLMSGSLLAALLFVAPGAAHAQEMTCAEREAWKQVWAEAWTPARLEAIRQGALTIKLPPAPRQGGRP